MQQRQLRLGDILDDYCPRERRVTNHVIVAMIGDDVKQVRCTTCDADHEFKHAKVPRQRRKSETPAALYAQVLATGPKRVTHEAAPAADGPSAVAVSPTPEEDTPIEPSVPEAQAVAMPEPARTRAGPGRRRKRRPRGRPEPRRRGRAGASSAHSRVASEDRRRTAARTPDPRVHHSSAGWTSRQPVPSSPSAWRCRRRPAISG